jgi:hypothetical protein
MINFLKIYGRKLYNIPLINRSYQNILLILSFSLYAVLIVMQIVGINDGIMNFLGSVFSSIWISQTHLLKINNRKENAVVFVIFMIAATLYNLFELGHEDGIYKGLAYIICNCVNCSLYYRGYEKHMIDKDDDVMPMSCLIETIMVAAPFGLYIKEYGYFNIFSILAHDNNIIINKRFVINNVYKFSLILIHITMMLWSVYLFILCYSSDDKIPSYYWALEALCLNSLVIFNYLRLEEAPRNNHEPSSNVLRTSHDSSNDNMGLYNLIEDEENVKTELGNELKNNV